MALDTTFTNGVIAVKEKQLLGDKLLRFPEMGAGEVLRALSESGFGGGETDPDAVYAHEQGVLDGFIRTYAPSAADRAYFLAPRDGHNLKALYKANLTGQPADGMLAPEGLYTIEELSARLEAQDPSLPSLPEDATGAQIGAAFDRAMFRELFGICRFRPVLRRLLSARVDMTNILTALRAQTAEEAEPLLLGGGTLGEKTLGALFSADLGEREHALDKTAYSAFYAVCLAAREKGQPFTDAERMREEHEIRYFFGRRFALSGKEPFLYYVFRRKAEIANVRTVLVCLNAGVEAKEIRRRLVGVM